MEDTKIVDLFFARDEQAIRETADKYGPYCMKISRNILQDLSDSEENVNDTYLQAWNAMPPHRPNSLSAFLGKLCRNLALNKYKARHAQKRADGEFALSLEELDLCTPASATVEGSLESALLGSCISRFLREEEASSRSVFVCRYFFCEPLEGIAKRFGYSESKIKSMLFRSRTRLRSFLTKEGYGFEK